MHQPKPNWNSF